MAGDYSAMTSKALRLSVSKTSSGFTLVEILIAVAIVGILGALAISQYDAWRYRKNRYEAIAALTKTAQELERQHSDTGNYSTSTIPTSFPSTNGNNQVTGNYTITWSNSPCGNVQGCYTVTATAQGEQANNDSKCFKFTLDNLGLKQSYDNTNAVTKNCWSQ